jgi:curli biogenesis system outer membrane secretion channel CsgG
MQKRVVFFSCVLFFAGMAAQSAAQTKPRDRIRDNIRERREARQSQVLTDEALALYKQGKIALAAEKVEQALLLDNHNDRALMLSAEIAYRQGRHEVALVQAEKALRINYRSPRAHFIMGMSLVATGKPLAGFDHLRKSANLLPPGADLEEARTVLARLKTQHPALFTRRVSTPVSTEVAAGAVGSEAASAVKPRLAVFTFENAGAVDSTMKWSEAISEMLTTALINCQRFKVIERAQLDKVLQEQALGQSGALDSETAVVVGKIMGLDGVVIGSLSQLASVYEADARILNVETGEAITAASGRAASADQLRNIAESVAGNFATHAHEVPVRATASDSTR